MLKKLTLAAGAFALAASFCAPAFADTAELLHDANITVNNLKKDPAFAQAARMINGARAVYIVPHLVKGGFIFGGQDALCRARRDHPAGASVQRRRGCRQRLCRHA